MLPEVYSSKSESDENPDEIHADLTLKDGRTWDPKREHPLLNKLLDLAFVKGDLGVKGRVSRQDSRNGMFDGRVSPISTGNTTML